MGNPCGMTWRHISASLKITEKVRVLRWTRLSKKSNRTANPMYVYSDIYTNDLIFLYSTRKQCPSTSVSWWLLWNSANQRWHSCLAQRGKHSSLCVGPFWKQTSPGHSLCTSKFNFFVWYCYARIWRMLNIQTHDCDLDGSFECHERYPNQSYCFVWISRLAHSPTTIADFGIEMSIYTPTVWILMVSRSGGFMDCCNYHPCLLSCCLSLQKTLTYSWLHHLQINLLLSANAYRKILLSANV